MKINVKDIIPPLRGTYHIRKYQNVEKVWIEEDGIHVDGELVETTSITNVFTTIGKQLILRLLGKKIGITGLEYIGIGTGAAAGQTALDTEVARAEIIYTSVITGASKYMVFSAYFDPDMPATDETISEIGIFGNGATNTKDSGDMLSANTVSPTVTKETGYHSLVVDYTLNFA